MKRYLLLIAMSASAGSAFGKDAEVKNVFVAPEGNTVRIEVDLSQPMNPTINMVANQLILEFPNAAFAQHSEYLTLNRNGVSEVQAGSDPANSKNTRVVVGIDATHPYAATAAGNKFVLSILPASASAAVSEPRVSRPTAGVNTLEPRPALAARIVRSTPGKPEVAQPLVSATIAASPPPSPVAATVSPVAAALSVRHIFKVKYIAGNTVYIDGGSNSGLRAGMNLEISSKLDGTNTQNAPVASARVIGVAATSAITEVSSTERVIQVGDAAGLTSQDAAAAAKNVQSAVQNLTPRPRLTDRDSNESSSLAGGAPAKSMVSSPQTPAAGNGTRMAGRVGIDYSSITSGGSTPGTSVQRGLSFQSDMTNILGTHWNLQGYWRGRINDHSQFREPTLEESLNKTYTMQLYYFNPASHWVAGVGRLYLPWAVSLDTIDGGYLGRKWSKGITTGVFAGSTPDLNSWHYRPNQRIGGSFINFEGGDYNKVHYSSTAGIALNTVVWKVDRPMAFFENEVSYKNMFTVYHSLIADTLRGVSTNGRRLPPGLSHSYFTAHYTPNRRISFDLYHNYFRDMPTATTTLVGTGLVDSLLFQGLSGGVHVRPLRNLSLYTTLGASEKSGDAHRSLNQNYGISWSEIARSGIRADVHYSKFDSNFGSGDYKVVSLSRQVTNRAFWNVQVGKQDLLSNYTTNHNSLYFSDSLDVNIGRRSYLQSGYTYVNGATMNYRQLYFSWGFRFDGGKRAPEFVGTQGPVH